MIKIMVLEDIKEISQGITLWGSVPHKDNQNPQQISEFLNQSLENIQSLSYLDHQGQYSHLPIKSFQVPSSIDGSFVLVFLIEKVHLPNNLTPGTILYTNKPENAALSDFELSTSI